MRGWKETEVSNLEELKSIANHRGVREQYVSLFGVWKGKGYSEADISARGW